MNKEQKEQVITIVSALVAEKAEELALKTPKKWVSYLFRFISTCALLLSGTNIFFS